MGGSKTGAAAVDTVVTAAVLANAALDFSNVHKNIPAPASAVASRLDPSACLRDLIVMSFSTIVDVILSLHNSLVLLPLK